MRDSFIFYRSFKDSMSDLSDTDRLIMYEAISDYSLDMKEPELTGFPKALFKLIRPILDANICRWKNGCRGGAPMGNKNNRYSNSTTKAQPKNNQPTTKVQANKDKDVNKDKDKNVEDKSSIGAQKSIRFIAPTLSEVENFIKENKYSVDAATFIDFYSSKGWMVGKNKMKDWRAAVRTWERKSKTEKNAKPEEIGIILRDNSSTKYDNDKLW